LATRISAASGEGSVGRAYFQRVLGARGFADALTINAIDPTRNGCLFFVPVRREPKLVPSLRARYAKLTAHMTAGFRLRRALGALVDEAVLEPGGKIAHADGEAKTSAARDSLREAV